MIAILLLGSALRMIALEKTPPGFYVDEAIESYDAYSIWHTGRDHHGTWFPIAFGGTNDYRMPLFIYSLAPIVGMAGLAVTTARLVAAFWSILGIASVYALGSRMVNRLVGLIAALFLAISPWHTPFGRFTHEGSAAVLTATLAIGMLWQWRARQRRSWIIGAAVISALGIYTYSTMKFFLPLMLLCIAIFWRHTLLAQWRQVMIAAAIGLLLVAPMLYLHVRDYEKMQARYNVAAVFQPGRTVREAAVEMFHNALNNLSPDFLFRHGDQDQVYHPQGIGQLYWAQAGLILLGTIWGLTHNKTRPTTILLGLWVLFGVMPAALTVHLPNSNSGNASRALIAVIPWQILSGLGIVTLKKMIHSRQVLWGIGLALGLWVGYDAWNYFVYYFDDYAVDAYHAFEGEMGAIVAQVAPLADAYDTIYLTCFSADFPYTQILFLNRYDPHLLQTDLPDRGDWLFAPVWRVGKYYITCDTTELWNLGLPGLYVVLEDELPDVTPLTMIPTQPGQRSFKLIARRTFDYDFTALSWLGQCTQPVAPLNPSLLTQNAPAARVVEFDCTSTWVYPSSATTGLGAYVLHTQLLSGDAETPPQSRTALDPFIQRHLNGAEIGFNMPRFTKDFPAFIIYDYDDAPTPPTALRGGVSSAATLPAITATATLSSPIALKGPLTFLGLALHPNETDVEVESWWMVATAPITRPISVMAHWLTTEGEILEVADGLGVAASTLSQGDIIVQRHRFTQITPEINGWLRVGGYWLDTMERWPVVDAGEADAIFVRIER